MKPTLDDIERSLRRYLSLTLEPLDASQPWRVRLEREPIQDDERPVAVIETGALSHPFKRATITQGDVTAAVPVTVTAYPETAGKVRETGLRARQLQQRLEDVATFGLDLGSGVRAGGGPTRPRSGPDRIPIYDYSAVAVTGPAAERSLPDGAEPVAWLRVDGSETDAIQDAVDATRWTVVWELRVEWDRGGRVPGGAPKTVAFLPAVPPEDGASVF